MDCPSSDTLTQILQGFPPIGPSLTIMTIDDHVVFDFVKETHFQNLV